MSAPSLQSARSVIRRIYLLLALTAIGGVLAFFITPPVLFERNREETHFLLRQQRLRDGLNDVERLALATHLGAVRSPAEAPGPFRSDLISELALNSRKALEAKLAQVTELARADVSPASAQVAKRLEERVAALLERPGSPAALEGVLLAIEQMHHLTVRTQELRAELFTPGLLDNERFVTGLLLVLLAAIAWAGFHLVQSSKRTVRDLADTIAQRDEQARALQHERDFATSLTDTAPAIILILDAEGAIRHVNPFFEQLTGWRRDEIEGRDWFATFLPERDRERVRGLFRTAMQGSFVRGHVNPILTRTGEEREIEWHSQAQHDTGGRVASVLAVGVDVTERKRAEEAIRRSLVEKETLLREIHHRVKNNLQIISSLLHFQTKMVHDTQSLAVFAEARERLRAMILVHEKLYNSRDLAEVEFADYVQALVEQFARTAGVSGRIRFTVETAPVMLPIGSALPCGMILVELLTNVIKYAFPEGRSGEALVRLSEADGRMSLTVADNGVGLPADFDPATTQSFGWQLIRNLTVQLNGTTTLARAAGTQVTLVFRHHPAT